MPHMLWGEVVNTASYILNICPTKQLHMKVLEEVWSGRNSSVMNLKVIGFVCFKDTSDQKWSKLDDKSEKMVFIGYHSTSAFKVHNLVDNKFHINKDVIFDESEAWEWQDTREKGCDIN